ncbi:site-specific DNA-methyltransferase [Candidatus Lucifugimonas marina]|uniref:Site-specific DNA-methyltransferase n=1 Tax=Candidatus Lucifugimonas marina TaxID=3038979 RepID=A0AAJ5ZEZ1_9CHLR|nr:site-specific DNA-methyltransferase [SAR202 cluster bacterium JH639]WFG38801.1 site-specific DNA-methyltransferase [SAR202 cluster bacterium JH1073]
MTEAPRVSLEWPNKDKALLAAGSSAPVWVDRSDPRANEVRLLRSSGLIGGGGTEEEIASGHLIVGDSLDALRAIEKNKLMGLDDGIRLLYIDPPFNTGQQFHQYSDSVGHAEWLSALRDRLNAVKPLLHPLASIWVHLDDGEVHRARCVLDEVFGADAFVSTIVWQKRKTRESRSAFSSNHDYIHVYAPAGPQVWKRSRNLLPRDSSSARNRDNDPRGSWTDAPFTAPGFRQNQHYPIKNPAGMSLMPPKGRSWYATEPVFRELLEDNRIWFPRDGAGLPRIKRFVNAEPGLVPFTLWGGDEGGTNDDAKRHLMSMFPNETAFATPKPESLLHRIIQIGTDPGDIVLDFFAGSGTTAAVAHKLKRRWVAIERSSKIVSTYLLPRMRCVIEGDDPDGVTKEVNWSGGGAVGLHSLSDSIYKEDSDQAELAIQEWAPELVKSLFDESARISSDIGPFICEYQGKRVAFIAGYLDKHSAQILINSSKPGDRLLIYAERWTAASKRLVLRRRPGSFLLPLPIDEVLRHKVTSSNSTATPKNVIESVHLQPV